jgi:hypothetical protein
MQSVKHVCIFRDRLSLLPSVPFRHDQRRESHRYAYRVLLAMLLAGSSVVSPVWLGTASAVVAHGDSSQVPYAISTSLPANLRQFLTVETSPYLFNVEHHYGTVSPAADGAYLDNKTASSGGPWAVEDQRYAQVDVFYGVLHDNVNEVRTGESMLDYAFSRESTDGSFSNSVGLFHGPAMFLAAAGPSLILLQNWNDLGTVPPLADSHTVGWMARRDRAAAQHLISAWWSSPKHIDDSGKEERFFEGALALQSAGVLTRDAALEETATVYARNGMRMTVQSGRNKGVWTEHGIVPNLCCYDASYQAVGLGYGARYLTLLNTGSFYDEVQNNLELGELWEKSRTRSDGSIDISGDDRTYNGKSCPERTASGTCKTIDYTAVADALMRWGVISDEPDSGPFIRRSYYVALQYEEQNGVKLPPPGLDVQPNSLTVSQVQYGLSMFVSGAGFQPFESVTLYFAGAKVGAVTVNLSGAFGYVPGAWSTDISPIRVRIPSSVSAGTYTIKGVGEFGTVRTFSVHITS